MTQPSESQPESDLEAVSRASESSAGGQKFPNEQLEEFVQLFGAHQRSLQLYVLSLVHDRDIADEILQETSLVLWREFHRFEIGTSFLAWSFQVAYHQMLAWRKRQVRDRLIFSNEFLAAVHEELASSADELEHRLDLLNNCIGKLPDHHRELIQLRYQSSVTIEEMASRLGRNADAIYRMLSRVRYWLHCCIKSELQNQALT